MTRISVNEARHDGYLVDMSYYPPMAYKGDRLGNHEMRSCLTDIEAELVEACQKTLAWLSEHAEEVPGSAVGVAALLGDSIDHAIRS